MSNREEEILSKICSLLSELNPQEIRKLVPKLLFSIGASLCKEVGLQSSEEVLKQYASQPTFANAMMAQALWMKETWDIPETEGTQNEQEL